MALVSGDAELTAGFLAAAAAAGVEVVQVGRAEELRPVWSTAAQVYLGVDAVEAVEASGLPPRPGVGLLTRPGGGVSRWSSAFDACVIELPDPDGVLMSRLAAVAGASGGEVVLLNGATGGVGVSTLALALGRTLAERGRSVLVVDLDPTGGGLDLAAGVERVPGWRWPDLAAARGQVGDLTAQLPAVDGLSVLAMPRDGVQLPSTAAVASVLASVRRWFDVCLLDCSRTGEAWVGAGLAVASRTWLVLREDVPGLAAAAVRRPRLAEGAAPVELVTVVGSAAALSGEAVERVVGAPLLARLPEDRRLRSGVGRGEPARVSASRRWRAAVRRLAAEVGR
ncbi:helicase/secretion neighborhood CpaE-like protein [Auraticoccus monumenti]|uniref:Helicase/secretion neighborhood CpaE-like protein n=1 Tax=Auraticoccus monumenti TaxID=675864 RepID=A0A1G6S0D2_9ACTN|nr:helicase/secretion neighborhood CpaE-like protein [Auraticoccus monumenti]